MGTELKGKEILKEDEEENHLSEPELQLFGGRCTSRPWYGPWSYLCQGLMSRGAWTKCGPRSSCLVKEEWHGDRGILPDPLPKPESSTKP